MFERSVTVKEPLLTFVAVPGEGRPLPTGLMVGHRLTGPMATALVVCGGAGLDEDLAALAELGIVPDVVIATSDAMARYAGKIGHVAILDPGLPEGFAAIRANNGQEEGNLDFATHLLGATPEEFARSGADYRWAFNPAPVPGCDVGFAAHMALALQTDRVILAGADGEGWDGERLEGWRALADGGLYSGRVILARTAGPLGEIIALTPARDGAAANNSTPDAPGEGSGKQKKR